MRRIAIVAGVAVALVLGGGTVAWFVGKGAVEDRLAELVAEADADGMTVTYSQSTVEGFPFGYALTVTDVAVVRRDTGTILKLPSLHADWDASDGDTAQVILPDTFEILRPVAEAARTAGPTLPAQFRLAGTASNWQATFARSDGQVSTTADSWSVALAQPDYATEARLDLTAVAFSAVAPGFDDMALTAATLASKVTSRPENGLNATLTVASAPAELALTSSVTDRAGLQELIYGSGPGKLDLVWSFGDLQSMLEIEGDPLGMDGTLSVASETTTGTASVTQGLLDLTADSLQPRWTLQAPNRPGGTLTARRTGFGYTTPVSPSALPQPARISFSLEGAEGQDDLWANIDPQGKLDHTPGDIMVDLGMTIRLLRRLDSLPAGAQPPYEISNIMVNQMLLRALGGEIQAIGDFEILQPMLIPQGELSISGKGLSGVLRSLGAAGMISPEMQEAGLAIIQVYARPGAGIDSWESDLRVGPEGLSMNGLPVQ